MYCIIYCTITNMLHRYFVCKCMYTVVLKLNHAHHRDTYICNTRIFACKRTYQNTTDLNLNHVHDSDTYILVVRYVAQILVCQCTTCTIHLNLNRSCPR